MGLLHPHKERGAAGGCEGIWKKRGVEAPVEHCLLSVNRQHEGWGQLEWGLLSEEDTAARTVAVVILIFPDARFHWQTIGVPWRLLWGKRFFSFLWLVPLAVFTELPVCKSPDL